MRAISKRGQQMRHANRRIKEAVRNRHTSEIVNLGLIYGIPRTGVQNLVVGNDEIIHTGVRTNSNRHEPHLQAQWLPQETFQSQAFLPAQQCHELGRHLLKLLRTGWMDTLSGPYVTPRVRVM